MKEQVISKDGHAFISIDAMQEVLGAMIAVRDMLIENDESFEALVPGSDHAASFIGQILDQVRFKFFAQENLDDETKDLLEGLNGFLDEQ